VPGLILETLATNAAFAVVALAIGDAVLRLVETAVRGSHGPPSLMRLGAAVLAGFGTCALGGIVLAALHLFRWQAFAVCGVAAVVLQRRALAEYARRSAGFVTRLPRAGIVVIAATLVVIAVFSVQWLAALAPPVAYDELSYHLPEAHVLADTHALHFTLGSHRTGTGIFGNLPTLAETIWGIALTVEGATLVHVLHLTMLAAFVLLAAGVVRTLWGSRPAALAAAGIALYPDIVQNAITGYIDAASASFEVGGVLLFVLWAARGDPGVAAAGALLIGFAAGMKYTALPSAALVAILVGVISVRQRSLRLPLVLAGIALAACVYWYAKNLIRFGNPFYPIAFGHPGITDALYRDWTSTVHHFGSPTWTRTITGFVDTPSDFDQNASIVPFAAFALAPFSLAARGPRGAVVLLLGYALAYWTYWYWLASNQTRFLMPAIVVAIILAAVALGAARGPILLAAAVAAALALALADHESHHSFSTDVGGTVKTWLGTSQARYALGLESTHAYLLHYFGCEVDAADVLAQRHLRGDVATWYLAQTMVFPQYNRFWPIHVDGATPASVRYELRNQGFRFAFTSGGQVTDLSPYPVVQQVLSESRPFWRGNNCTLYRLALGPR
jgi:hypothetical protein